MEPGRLVEVRVSWPGHPRYLKKKKKNQIDEFESLKRPCMGGVG